MPANMAMQDTNVVPAESCIIYFLNCLIKLCHYSSFFISTPTLLISPPCRTAREQWEEEWEVNERLQEQNAFTCFLFMLSFFNFLFGEEVTLNSCLWFWKKKYTIKKGSCMAYIYRLSWKRGTGLHYVDWFNSWDLLDIDPFRKWDPKSQRVPSHHLYFIA